MCGTGIEDPDRRVGKPSRGFLCGIVGEAKKHNVCALQRLAASRRLLALRFGKHDDFKIIPAFKPVADPKRRRSSLTVDVKFGSHSRFSLSGIDKDSTLICTA